MKLKNLLLILISLCVLISGCADKTIYAPPVDIQSISEYSGAAFEILSENIPDFDQAELKPECFEKYSELDFLGRCGPAFACIGTDIMPTEERGSIGQVKPSGWQISKYDFVDGKYLYNRCHLIGYQLTGENANEQNLITGTRYLNTEGMLPFENMVADYVKESGNHVLYRVTPVFEGENLVASGVKMEAMSVEDGGKGICFNVYVYNVQPGVEIDYLTGDNKPQSQVEEIDDGEVRNYILNTNSKKFHQPDCANAKDIKRENRQVYSGTRKSAILAGYKPCGGCNP